jgi:hypothetical protein
VVSNHAKELEVKDVELHLLGGGLEVGKR